MCREYRKSYELHLGSLRIKTSLTQALSISSLFFLVTIYTFNTTFHNHLFYGWSHIKIVYISIFFLMDMTVIQPNNSLLNCFEIHLHLVSTKMLMILVKSYTKTTSKWKNWSSKVLGIIAYFVWKDKDHSLKLTKPEKVILRS